MADNDNDKQENIFLLDTEPDLPAYDTQTGMLGKGEPSEDSILKQDRIRRFLEMLTFVVGFLLIAAATITVTVIHPEREPMSDESREAYSFLRDLEVAQTRYYRDHGNYADDFKALGLADQTELFDYRVFLPKHAGSYTAYATWKDDEKRPKRFMRLDTTGRIKRLPGTRRQDIQAPDASVISDQENPAPDAIDSEEEPPIQ